jgi:glycosyltransferase XagB
MLTLLTHCRTPRRSLSEFGLARALCALELAGGPLIGFLIGPIVVVRCVVALAHGQIFGAHGFAGWLANSQICFVSLTGLAAIVWPLMLGAKRRRLSGFTRELVWLPGYFLLLFCACWWALLDLWRNPHGWAKTEHGLTRSRRTGSRTSEPVS